MKRALVVLALAALHGLPLHAQPLEFPLADVLSLGSHAYARSDDFREHLEAVLPDARFEPEPDITAEEDPFRWALGGTFGGQGASPRPGALFGCARYGLATRDLFAEHGFARPETFGLMGAVLPLADDAEVWPEAAVARLHCTFIWDDAETVAILLQAEAVTGLSAVFSHVESESGGLFLRLLGEDGFRLSGWNEAGDTMVWVESGDVILTNGHQQVSFRAYLIGGAV
ncbi:hypothetical protein [Gymnodinialimonas hymeniacidonis]|uniref:hypothetical protein n=1 Tax=Gymnodinialimonas hymeniacidonis TaxID=3126508 RepID=UPI0034C65669